MNQFLRAYGLLIVVVGILCTVGTAATDCTRLQAENTQLKQQLYGDPAFRVAPVDVDGKKSCPVDGFNLRWEVTQKQDVTYDNDYYDEGGDPESHSSPTITNQHGEFVQWCERH